MLGNFELNRPTGFLLDHSRSVTHLPAGTNIIDLQPNGVAAPEFAVDREIEHGQVTFAAFKLESDADDPHILRLQRAFLADQAALVPRIVLPTR